MIHEGEELSQLRTKRAQEPIPRSLEVWGSVTSSNGASLNVAGLDRLARLGDRVELREIGERPVGGEVVAIRDGLVTVMLTGSAQGLASGQRAYLVSEEQPRPSEAWLGQVLDAFGRTADGRLAGQGREPAPLLRQPPRGDQRRPLGARLQTGLAALDTFLPLCRGQRLGVFAGSGVGKSRLMVDLALGVAADVVVIGLIGERGREVGDFVRHIADANGMARTVVIAATSDQSALIKRRAAMLTLATAEYFRDRGFHVMCLVDSVTRFAEAHREIALAAGEAPALRAFPPSTAPAIAALCERAGPGEVGRNDGDITAVFTVLVAGSDLDEPVSDMVRGVLDGHVVLDRNVAERGRFPAIDLRRSVSRSAPSAWSAEEEGLVTRARQLLAAYEDSAAMIQAGLYTKGADPLLDEAVLRWGGLDRFIGTVDRARSDLDSFAALAEILNAPAEAGARGT